jgi:hypothetical protein
MYSNDMTWQQWSQAATASSEAVINDIQQGKELYDKFYALTYGLTDPQILALGAFSNRTQTDLNNIRFALGVFNDLYGALNNLAVTQANRMGYLEPFV